jgi:hypothetical protein
MRRLLSILLLAFFGLGPAVSAIPAAALGSGWTGKVDESRLPACCRRNGKHHCAMGAAMAAAAQVAGGETSLSANDACPFAPQSIAATAPTVAAVLFAAADPALLASELCVLLAAVSFAALASRRTQPMRGPPTLGAL